MTAQPGRPQASFTAGELSPALAERTDLKYYRTGAKQMVNVEILPQGGFRQAPGLRQRARLSINTGTIKVKGFTAADGSISTHVWRPTQGDVYNDSGPSVQASYSIPFSTNQQITLCKSVQQLDTMLAFEKDAPPYRILRQGSDASWAVGNAPLVNIPLHDYGGPIGGGSYSNGVAAVWQIRFVGEPNNATSTSFHYVATLSGNDTTVLQFPDAGGGTPDYSAMANVIKNALLALPGVNTGITVVQGLVGGQPVYTVTFSGTGNDGNDWTLSFKCTDKSDIAAPCYLVTVGVTAGEAIISAGRGWPRCGVLYQQRLLLGGFKSLPNAWMASFTGDYYDFNTIGAAANGAMLVPMDTAGGEAIQEMVNGRSLLILTSLAEYFLSDRAISKATAPNHIETSRHGSAEGVASVENEGSAVFVDHDGGVLYEFHYDDVGQTFVTQNMSLLASHLVSNVSEMAKQRSTKDNDANQLYFANTDGSLRVFALLREQNVTGGTRRATDGTVLTLTARTDNTLAMVTQRTVNGAPARFLEFVERDLLLDQATNIAVTPASKTVPGLLDYEGAQVWAIADNDVLGPFTVVNGTITLPQKASVVTVGRWTPPLVETLPLPRDVGPGIVVERKARIHTVRISVEDTTSIAVGANGGKVYDVPLLRFGDTMDVPALQNKFTGVIKIQGLTGYADKPTVTITQKRPGFLHVRGITVEAAL